MCFKIKLYQNLPGPATQVTKLNKGGLAAEKGTKGEGGKEREREVIFIVIHCVCPDVWAGNRGTHKSMCDRVTALQLNQCH